MGLRGLRGGLVEVVHGDVVAWFSRGLQVDSRRRLGRGFIRLYGLPERVRAMTRDEVTVDVKAVDITQPVVRPEGQKK